ncbi:hypothetical protein ACE41H_15515 [Paenibacillus enshidis]|uniref:Uncharacterized protein n=1 Tax=Paenibacillus enshidis TaxID=1458439 RepID=A0ABV5AVE3_9BACL
MVNIFGGPQWAELTQLGGLVATPDRKCSTRGGYGALRLDSAASFDLTAALEFNKHGRVAVHPVAVVLIASSAVEYT